jgi:hypothetical protein
MLEKTRAGRCSKVDVHSGTSKMKSSYTLSWARAGLSALERRERMQQVIEGQRGFKWWFNLAVILVALAFFVWFGLTFLATGHGFKTSTDLYILRFVVPCFALVGCSRLWFVLTYRVRVSAEGILETRGRTTMLFPFSECVRVGVRERTAKNAEWRILTVAINFSDQPHAIFTRPFDNDQRLEKSILENAVAARPDIEIDQHWLNTYGRPPYSDARSSVRTQTIRAGD